MSISSSHSMIIQVREHVVLKRTVVVWVEHFSESSAKLLTVYDVIRKNITLEFVLTKMCDKPTVCANVAYCSITSMTVNCSIFATHRLLITGNQILEFCKLGQETKAVRVHLTFLRYSWTLDHRNCSFNCITVNSVHFCFCRSILHLLHYLIPSQLWQDPQVMKDLCVN